MAPVLKTGGGKTSGGSNPSPSSRGIKMKKYTKRISNYSTYVVKSLSQKEEVYHLPTIVGKEYSKYYMQIRPFCGLISERFKYILRSKIDESKICNKCIVNAFVKLMQR